MIKDIFFLIALVFFACVDSWGACVSGNFTGCNVSTGLLTYICGSSCNYAGYVYIGDYIDDCPSTCGNLSGFSFSSSMASMCNGNANIGQ